MRWLRAFSAVLLLVCGPVSARADDVAAFYSGKTLRIIDPFGAGAGFYTPLAQLLADYLPRYLPGQPKGRVEFMPGGGGLQGANYLYAAPNDGTVYGLLYDNMPTAQALQLDDLTKFDARRFSVLGSLNKGETGLLGLLKRTGVTSIADARNKTTVLGATGTASAQFIVPAAINKVLGTKFNVIPGYESVNDTFLAMDTGELDGIFTNFNTIMETRPNWIAEGRFNWLAQVGDRRDPEFADVPLLQELVEKPLDKGIFTFLALSRIAGKPVVAPPGVPGERLAALRSAFAAMMRDPEFQAAIVKMNLKVDPRTAEEATAVIVQTVDTPASVREYFRMLIQPGR
jgi:tripartite-type tricarboxylate transporter receptor subunit TctC